MKRLLALLVIFLPLVVFAQPILRNPATTNAPAQLSVTFPTLSDVLQPIAHKTGVNTVYQGGAFAMTGTNTSFTGWVALSGKTNQVSDSGTQLLYNGNPIDGGGGITNSGVGTNNYLTKWTGTNSLGVSVLNDDGTNVTAGDFFLTSDTSTSSVLALGGNTLNPDAALTLFNPIAWSDSAGPYINGDVSGGVDIVTLGLDNGAGSTKTVQRIQAAKGLTAGIDINLYAGIPTAGHGGKVVILASSGVGVDQDGADVRLIAGNATGSGTPGNITLTSGSGGVIEAVNDILLDTVSVSSLLATDAGQIVTSIANAAGVLTNDGAGGFGWANDIGSASNPINNFYSTNNFFISGKGNTLVITQTLTVSGQYVYPLVPGTGITFATNNIGTGQTNLTISASGGGGVTTAVTALAYSGTNITGFNCLTNNATYTLLLTNHCLFNAASFTGLPNTTTNMFFTLALKQDGTGTWVPKFTNSIVAWTEGIQPVITTNANSISYLYFHSHLWTNGMLVGSPNLNVK